MNFDNTLVPVSRGRKALVAVVAAGILSAAGAGSFMSWSANANVALAVKDTGTVESTRPAIDLDSLYAAKADEAIEVDSIDIALVPPDRTITGRASWYGPGFHGRRTANGERFDRNEMTAAHKSLPFGTLVRVVHQSSGRSVLVRINDRGPYSGGRILDLSEGAAGYIGIKGSGTGSVRLEIYNAAKASSNAADMLTFDDQGRGVRPRGYGVKLTRIDGFDAAAALQHQLIEKGYKDVYLSQVLDGKKVSYEISVGLFNSDKLCATLLADVAGTYKAAEIVRYDQQTKEAVQLTGGDSSSAGSGL